MKTLQILTLLTLAIGIDAFGQKIDTTYFGLDWKLSTKPLSSYFRVTKTIIEGQKYKISDYFKSGELQMTGAYSSLDPQVREGEFNWYYKNGNQRSQHFYQRNELQAEMDWDENGKLILQKEYRKLKITRDGKESYDYVSMDKFPKYPGGMAEVYKFIARQFVMPLKIRYKPGKIVVKFSVDKDGHIIDAEITDSIHPLIDKEALRVVKSLSKMGARSSGWEGSEGNYESSY